MNAMIASALLIIAHNVLVADAHSNEVASSERIRWQGRVRRGDGGRVSFSWAGTQAMMTVRNASQVSMWLSSDFRNPSVSLFRVFVDRVPGLKIHVDDTADWKEYTLISGLDTSREHNITVYYATDPVSIDWNFDVSNCSTTIGSFATDGTFSPPPPERQRRLEFIGASVTAGDHFGFETVDGEDKCRGDHSGSFAALTCEYYQANCTTTALSGHGAWRNCCTNDDAPTMAGLTRRVIAGDASVLVDDDAFLPDAVVLNLGGNDERHITDSTTRESFVSAYISLLKDLADRHGGNRNLPIFVTIGPGDWHHTVDPLIFEAATQARDHGLTNVHFLNLTTIHLDGCQLHPGRQGHNQIFELLQEAIEEVLGWNGDAENLLTPPRRLGAENSRPAIVPTGYSARAASIGIPGLLLSLFGTAAVLCKRYSKASETNDDDASLEV